MSSTIEIFCCYARKDQPFLIEIKKHLMPLQRQGIITIWSDTDINAGMKWEEEIKLHLDTAHIILLLVSADFMHSDYCYSIEMSRAMQRHEQGDAQVIPIIVRPVIWESTPFCTLQALPTNAYPIVKWNHPDDAYVDVAKEIRNVVEKLMRQLHSRKIALFGYETQGGSTSALWNSPDTFSLNGTAYPTWLATKRDLTEEEIVNQTWVKVGDHGNCSIIAFRKGGKLFETSFSNPGWWLPGTWMFVGKMLRSFSIAYELDILAYRDNYIYSGVEYENGMNETKTYCILLPSQKLNTKFEEMEKVRDTEHYEDAINGYNKIIQYNPRCGLAYKAKGDILRDLERYEEALVAYQQTIDVWPGAWGWCGKGEALYKLHRYEEALEAFEQAIKLGDRNAKPWHGKGQVLQEQRSYRKALTAFDQAIALHPDYAAAYYGKGLALYHLNADKGAIDACQQAIKLDPRDARAYALLGLVLCRLGQYEEGLSACEQALSIDDTVPDAYLGKGRALSGLARYTEALVLFERAIHYAPHFVDAHLSRGDVLSALGRYEEALGAYEQALCYAPDTALVYGRKGDVLYYLQRYEEALAAYEKASDLGYQPSQPYYDFVKKLKAIGVITSPLEHYGRTQDGRGWYWHYAKISVYQHPEMGIYSIGDGPIRAKWANLGWEKGFLGYLDSDQGELPDHAGRHCHFRSNPQQKEQDGCIYWHPDTGAHEVHGGVRHAWGRLGWEQGLLGYPVTDELLCPDGKGRYNHFQHGSIYWTVATDAHEVHGKIREQWIRMGWEQSVLGYPITDQIRAPDGVGRISYFQHGAIYLSSVDDILVLKGQGKSLQERFTNSKEFALALEQARKPVPTTLAVVIYYIRQTPDENNGYYCIGKNLDANGIAAEGWGKLEKQPLTMKEHQGVAIALADLDGFGFSDMVVFRIYYYSEGQKSIGAYKVGKNLRVDGTFNSWCKKAIQVPGPFGKQNLDAGIALFDLNKSGKLDLLCFYVECSENEKRGFYCVGKDFDSDTLKPKSWDKPLQVPGDFGTEQYCTGIALCDLDGNGRPDLIVFYVEHEEGENRGYYRVGKHLDGDGVVTGGWGEPLQVPRSLGRHNHGASITIADLNRNGRLDLVVFYIEHPEGGGENRGYYRVGKNLDADGYVRGGWSRPIEVPGEFGTENQGAGIAIFPF